MPLPSGAQYIAGYLYFTPNNSSSTNNSFYSGLWYQGTGGFIVRSPEATGSYLPSKTYPTYPLNQYGITYATQSGDYITSDNNFYLSGGTAGPISVSDLAGYWINKDASQTPPMPFSGYGFVYQHYVSTVYIGRSGLPDAQPFGQNPIEAVTATSALPQGAYWVTGTISTHTSAGLSHDPINYIPAPGLLDPLSVNHNAVQIPQGSYILPDGTIITPDGHTYKGGSYSHANLEKTPGAAPSSMTLASLTDPQKQQQEFYDYLTSAIGQGFQFVFDPKISKDYNYGAKLTDAILSQERTSENASGALKANDPAPSPVESWQCRIGGSLFFVPPVSISVNQTFEAGSLTGSAIRQISSPKFNSGHSETSVTMTLFFPGVDQIWGYVGGSIHNLDFNTAPAQQVDTFLASLRGLIAQFRYTPFVPVVNEYLNSVWNITSVGFRGMNLSTVPGYPFLIRCDLELVRFSHEVYLPMVATLDDAIDWGRFRQYVGRAAVQMDEQANQAFALQTSSTSPTQGAALYQPSGGTNNIDQAGGPADITGTDSILNSSIAQDIASANYGTNNTSASTVEFFFPTHDPASYLGPSYNITEYGFDPSTTVKSTQGLSPGDWNNILQAFGLGNAQNGYVPMDGNQLPDLQQIESIDTNSIQADLKYVEQYFNEFNSIINALGDQTAFNKYKTAALAAKGYTPANAPLIIQQEVQGAWYWYIWQRITTSNNFLDSIYAIQNYLRGTIEIDEWDVPMAQLPLDGNFIVEQVSVNLGNNLARLQLHMLDQPAYQHVGGLDTSISISATCVGEANLTKIRNMFDTINNLARLEHSHAVLGFLGIRNLIVALAGTRYVIPKSYDVQTIPGYPHVYKVQLSFLDFDVFQQKREMLSTKQETQFTQIMSKRNPFLRLQQVWTAFNAYSDFPLAVRDDKNNILGYLDPDYYFKSFQTIDDDVVQNFAATPNYSPYIALPAITNGAPPSDTVLTSAITTNGGSSTNNLSTQNSPQPIGSSLNSDYQMVWHFGPLSDSGNHQSIGITGGGGMDLRTGNSILAQNVQINEAHAGNTQLKPIVKQEPNQPYLATPASGYIFPNFALNKPDPSKGQSPQQSTGSNATTALPYVNHNGGSSMGNFQGMLQDLQYRNNDGRMIRAFPTYMLWFIDEGGLFAGVQLFGDFYGLQSVIDFSHVANQDVLGDTLVIRISNLYSRLSTDYQEQVDPAIFPGIATLINPATNIIRQLGTGLDPFAVANIATINLKPGARLHLRVGYGSNPNLLETIFNGTITEVQQGDILTITAQSDAIELGALVNTTNPDGSSGHIDGSLTSGFYLSEPRDLIVRLLSMGNSNWQEMISYATRGMLFSQNRFGIRHFGSILYDTVSPRENSLQNGFTSKLGSISGIANQWLHDNQDVAGGGGAIGLGVGTGLISPQIGSIAMQLWANLNASRSYEIFKRNVYPGNGLGIANYMGGDLGDGGVYTAFQAPGVNADGQFNTAPPNIIQQLKGNLGVIAGQTPQAPGNQPSTQNNNSLINTANQIIGLTTNPVTAAMTVQDSGALHPIWQWLGLTPTVNDDIPGQSKFLNFAYGPFAEVSFRAETYQRTVWDLFQVCAKLLPNYIVAVRPFMERSTVFYGKPHWAWTSGVIPITYGADASSNSPHITDPQNFSGLQNSINNIMSLQQSFNQSTQTPSALYEQITSIINSQKSSGANTSNNPNNGTNADGSTTTGGDPNSHSTQYGTVSIVSSGGGSNSLESFEITALPLTASSGATIPVRSGASGLEMHLPTSNNLTTDEQQHKQLASLPQQFQHPFYMDRSQTGTASGAQGGIGGYVTPNTFDPSLDINSQTILPGDDPGWPGREGAFGFLDPDSEQYYIAMDWDNSGSNYPSAWKDTRILVYCQDTQKGCICTPGDWGPAGFTNRVSGISPDTWQVLGRPSENAILWYGFIDPSSTLGPVQWQTGMTFQGSQLPTNAGPLDLTLLNADHTNASTNNSSSGSITTSSGGTTVLTGAYDPAGGNNPILGPADLPQLSLNNPLNQTDSNGDTYLSLAHKVYEGAKTDSEAIQIIDQWTKEFGTSIADSSNPDSTHLYKIFTGQQKVAKNNNLGGIQIQPYNPSNTHTTSQQFQQDFIKAAGEFYTWMISNPYNLGWIVLTAGVKLSGVTGAVYAITSLGGLPFQVLDDTVVPIASGLGKVASTLLGQNASNDPLLAIVHDVSTWIPGFGGGNSAAHADGWDLSPVYNLFAVWMTLGPGANTGNPSDATNSTGGAIEWMLSNATPGKTEYDFFGGQIIDKVSTVTHAISSIFSDAHKFVDVAFGAITDILRFSMTLLNMGVNLSGFSGQQANLLSSVLNDSYYYDPALGVGSLLWQVDNCFTREYGEPVIEVREPFQRVHYVNSFQHILADGLIETMNNVYCVDEETEILTENGWKLYNEVIEGELALTLNHETGFSEWQPINSIHIFPAQPRILVSMEGNSHSSLTTPNHRWPIIRGNNLLRREWATTDSFKYHDKIILSAPNIDKPTEPKYSDAFVELVAWFWTDGHIYKGVLNDSIKIYQSITYNPQYVERIRLALYNYLGEPKDKLNPGKAPLPEPKWSECKKANHGEWEFRLNWTASRPFLDVAPNRVVSIQFLRELTQSQLELFIKVSMMGDNSGPYELAQADSRMSDSFQIACTLAGYATSNKPITRTDPQGRKYSMHNVIMRRQKYCKPFEATVQARRRGKTDKSFTTQEVLYCDQIWCPSIENGTWLARRRGNVYFTGNTVVTASANGKAPHTAWFDKGAPSQYQYEKVVDTGLYLDSPTWYSFFLHPSEVIRDTLKHMNNSDDATEASRFARAELQRSLKNIYAGEIMVLGDPSIRPFDLLYISDSYERIYGLCEVQQVVHHFTPETGFVTSITPSALVTVNDPERWEAGSILQRQMAVQDLRNLIRRYGGIVNSASGQQGLSSTIDINTLIQQQEAALQGTTQFSGGATAILKDVAGSASMGSAIGKIAASGAAADFGGPLTALTLGGTAFLGWEAFKWVRENLLDAHGCYIQYLNRNGSPMDAGLSYNQGVAVGQMHVYSGLQDILGISIPYSIDGQPFITTSNLLQNLGWQEQNINNLKTSISMWTSNTRSQIAGAYSTASNGVLASGVYTDIEVQIVGIIDSTTLAIKILSSLNSLSNFGQFRLQYLTPASVDGNTPMAAPLALFNPLTSASAEGYMSTLFLTGPDAATNNTCYIRVDPNKPTDPNDPSTLMGVLFYNVAPGTVAPPPTAFQPTDLADVRLQTLQGYASQNPPIGWQDIQHDGTPFTLNWEMVVTNHATIDASLLLPTGQGAATNILSYQSGRGV